MNEWHPNWKEVKLPLLQIFFIQEILRHSPKKKKKKKKISKKKKEKKKDTKKKKKKLSELIKEFSNVPGNKINIQKSVTGAPVVAQQ